MNWRERFKPLNSAEVGCYSFLFIFVVLIFMFMAAIEEYFMILAVALYFIFHVIKLGNETVTTYEVTPKAAYSVAALLVLAFAIAWIVMALLAVLSAWVMGFVITEFIAELVAFLLFVILAYYTYSPMVRFKTTILEKWLGWQRKDVIVNG